MIKKVCIYCASSTKVGQVYFDAVDELAKELIKANIGVVYGGGGLGLMGRLADQMIAGGGQIQGIMPKFMKEVEWQHKGVTDFIFTEDMHERKRLFLEGIDAIISLPGGCGTFEELFEAITLKRLGKFTKPIIILNTNSYYDPFKVMMKQCIDQGFMSEAHGDIWNVVDTPREVIPAIGSAVPWDEDAIQFASVK